MEAPLRSASCSSQLTAILKKNGRLKRRGWCTTCCEIVSPALFCCILLLGYSLSEVFVRYTLRLRVRLRVRLGYSLVYATQPCSCSLSLQP